MLALHIGASQRPGRAGTDIPGDPWGDVGHVLAPTPSPGSGARWVPRYGVCLPVRCRTLQPLVFLVSELAHSEPAQSFSPGCRLQCFHAQKCS